MGSANNTETVGNWELVEIPNFSDVGAFSPAELGLWGWGPGLQLAGGWAQRRGSAGPEQCLQGMDGTRLKAK